MGVLPWQHYMVDDRLIISLKQYRQQHSCCYGDLCMLHVSHSAHTPLHNFICLPRIISCKIIYWSTSIASLTFLSHIYLNSQGEPISSCARESATLVALARTVSAWTSQSQTHTHTAYRMLTYSPVNYGGRKETSSSKLESPHAPWRLSRRTDSTPQRRSMALTSTNSL